MNKNIKRNVGEIYYCRRGKRVRRRIVTENGCETYAVYVAKQNPDICGEWFEGCEVHHKDGNPLNDQPENLICLTPQEHTEAHKQLPHSGDKKVTIYYDGESCGTYPSITQLSESLDIPKCVIQHYIKCQKPFSAKWADYVFHLG